jgi:hypothetical protein
MKLETVVEYISVGGNRHPSAADWSEELLAFGAGNNIALWNPKVSSNHPSRSFTNYQGSRV